MTTRPPGEGNTETPDPENQEQQQQPNATSSGNSTTTTGSDEWTPERAMNTIQNLRKIEADYKKQVGDLTTRIKAFEDKDRTEVERLQQERDELIKERDNWTREKRETRTKSSFVEAAQKAGSTKPDALYKLANGDIETDDDGEPKNLTNLIKSLKQDFPELFNISDVDAGAGRGRPPSGTGMNELLRQARGR